MLSMMLLTMTMCGDEIIGIESVDVFVKIGKRRGADPSTQPQPSAQEVYDVSLDLHLIWIFMHGGLV